MKKLCIIIFSRNETKSLFDTYERILAISNSKEVEGVIKEVFVVDDGSSLANQKIIENFFSSLEFNQPFIFHYYTQTSQGIANTVVSALKKMQSDSDLVLPLPGHDMFGTEALMNLILNSNCNQLTVGYRSNLFKERPFLKFISAKILTGIYKLLVYPKIKDAHGLYILPTDLAKNYIYADGGHEILIFPFYMALKKNLVINQVPIHLRQGHKIDSHNLGRSSKTRFSHAKSSLGWLLVIIKDKIKINKY